MYCKLYFVWYIIYWKYSVACPSTKSLGLRRVWAQSWSVLGPWIRSCCSPGTGTGHWRGDQARSRTVSVLAIKTDTVQVLVRTLIWASRSLGPGLGLKILGIGHIWYTVYWHWRVSTMYGDVPPPLACNFLSLSIFNPVSICKINQILYTYYIYNTNKCSTLYNYRIYMNFVIRY